MRNELVNPLTRLIAAGAARHVSSLDEEYEAATRTCIVFPAVHRAVARATGEDRVSFLQGMLSNDVLQLVPGRGMAAAFLTDSGQVVADLRLYCSEDAFDIDCVSWRIDHLRTALDKYIIADDVEIDVDEQRMPLLCLEGPESGRVAASALGVSEAMERFSSAGARVHGGEVSVYAVSDAGGEGRLMVGSPALATALLEACLGAGATAAGLGTLDVLRVEAGIPWAGVDMNEDTLLLEMGIDETISRTKGCYLGQEIVERVSARGQVNRSLTAFAIGADSERLPAEPLAVHRAGESSAVGSVTSWVFSPAIQGTLGMGLLHRKGRDAGSLEVVLDGERVPCEVVEFPRRGR